MRVLPAGVLTSPSAWFFNWLEDHKYEMPRSKHQLVLQNNLHIPTMVRPVEQYHNKPISTITFFARLEVCTRLYIFTCGEFLS